MAPQGGVELLGKDEDAHDDDEPAEGVAQRVRRDAAREPGADQAAGHRRHGHGDGEAPVDGHAGEVSGESGEGLHCDDQQRGADGDAHRQSTEDGERRDDEESAAGADQTGHGADDEALDGDVLQRQVLGGRPGAFASIAGLAKHGEGGGQHHQGERDEQDGAGDVRGDAAAGIGAGHAEGAEEQPGLPADPVGAGMRYQGGEAGDADDEQGGGDGLLRALPGEVDQDRDREDGAAATEDAEADADQQGGRDDEGGHDALRSSAMTVRMSVRGPRL
ncbi:hypothetical protein SHO565_74030 [Streptomyces sp. HO565]